MSLANIQFDPRMFDDLPAMVWIVEANGQPVYFNKAALTFAQRESATTLATEWFNSVHVEDQQPYLAAIRRSLDQQQPFALEYRRQNGSGEYRRLSEQSTPLHDPGSVFRGFVGFITDVTDRSLIGAEAGGGAAQVELLSKVTHDIVWDWELRTNEVAYNAAFVEALGTAPAEYHAAHAWWRTRAHPDDLERVCALYDEAIKTVRTSLFYEYRILDHTGAHYLTLDSRASLMRDSTGQLIRVLVASRDISVRRLAEDAQARLIRILEATTDYVGMGTLEGRPLYINAAGRRMIGLGPDDSLDFNSSTCHPDWANEIIRHEAIPTAIQDGYWSGENAILHRDGHEIPVSQVLLTHRDADGKVEFVSTIIRDLSERKREEVERIEWANRYDAAIRASGQVLFDWNSFTNEITYAGDMEHVFGYTMGEMAGGLDRLRQLIHPADLPNFDQRVQQVVITRDPFQMEFRLQHKLAGVICLETKGYFFLDRRGQIGRMVGFFSDVTTQRHAQQLLAEAHDILEQRVTERTAELARASAMIEDRAHRQEAVAHLGQHALSGAALSTLMSEAMKVIKATLRVDCCSLLAMTRDGHDLLIRAQTGWPDPEYNKGRVPVGTGSQSGYTLMTGESVISPDVAAETRFTHSPAVVAAGVKSGLSVLIKGDEGPLGVLAAFTTTQRNFVPDDLHFLQSVGNVLTAAIQRDKAEENIRQAREEAETASRAKSEFLSRMSHELRTPLNAILGFTQLLEIDKPTPSQAESVDHISRAGKHLLSLINEVLDISRIEAGRLALSPEPIEIHDFLREALDLIRPLAQRHEVELILEPATPVPSLHVLADRQRLQQVLFNLLSNAVKYNQPGGRVTASYRAEAARLRITIADTGRGIEADKLARLFLPFERLGAESTEVEGAGIGLALSRGIVTALHGELSVESRVDEGSTFWITLPRAEDLSTLDTPAPISEPTPALKTPDAQQTLLYIEDHDLNLRLVERILGSRSQYRLLTAMQGGLGLALAHEHRPDLILLDLNLPDMTGDNVLHRLKSNPATRSIPVVMVSADAMGERIQQLLRLGASGYLTKPYKLEEFLRVIEKALANP